MVTLTDILTLKERRILFGRATEEGDPGMIEYARKVLEDTLLFLRQEIDGELETLQPERPLAPSEPAPVLTEDTVEFFQRQADNDHQTLLVLGKLCSVIHGSKPGCFYAVAEQHASEWERRHALLILSPKLETVEVANHDQQEG